MTATNGVVGRVRNIQRDRTSGRRAVAIFCLATLTVLAACGGGSGDYSVITEGSSPAANELEFGETTWQDVYDTLSSSAQTCVRDKFDDSDLYDQAFVSVMDQPILGSPDSPSLLGTLGLSAVDYFEFELENAVRVAIFACAPDTVVTTMLQEANVDQDDLNDDERRCLRDNARSIRPTGLIDSAITSDGFVDPASLSILACAPATALTLNVSLSALGRGARIEDVELPRLNDAQVACIQGHARTIDLSDPSPETDAAVESIFDCAPVAIAISDLSISAALAGERLTSGEKSCLRDFLRPLDPLEAEDDAVNAGVFGCAPTVFLGMQLEFWASIGGGSPTDEEKSCARDFVRSLDSSQRSGGAFEAGILMCTPVSRAIGALQNADVGQDELSDDEIKCLRELARPLDPSELADDAIEDAWSAFFEGIVACVPQLRDEFVVTTEETAETTPVPTPPPPPVPIQEPREELLEPRDDDHGETTEDATAAAINEPIEGSIEDIYDIDLFVFEAEAGVTYQIDVTPGTMTDPILELYNAYFDYLDYSDDYEGLAPRIYWEAPSSDTYYVAVEGYDEGTYTLLIASQ